MMKVHLPNSAFLGNIDTFLSSFDPSEKKVLEISSNQKWLSVHPVVLSMVASLGTGLEPASIKVHRLEARSAHYLERMRLFESMGVGPQIEIQEHEPAGRFIPLTRIDSSDSLSSFISEMVPLLHQDPAKASSIKYVISELVRNTIEHSNSEYGAFVCAQYYPKSNMVRVGIADSGVGIKKTISQSHTVTDDLGAIGLALTPGITGTTRREGGTETNAGAGLFFIKSIASVNRDFFMIYSGNAMYKLLRSTAKEKMRLNADPFKDRHSSRTDLPYWNGTVVGIDISLEPNVEFTTLLSKIGKTFSATIKQRKQQRFRRPRFI
jgi:anti-sigma regulatory factor (Ser/Thr protein kinase)